MSWFTLASGSWGGSDYAKAPKVSSGRVCRTSVWVHSDSGESDSIVKTSVLVQSVKVQAFLGGDEWSCHTPEEGHRFADNSVCKSCRWFDTEKAGSLVTLGKLGHLDDQVPAYSCLDGSFREVTDIGAWLRRTKLVNNGRYMAACISPVRRTSGLWTILADTVRWVAIALPIAWLCCLPVLAWYRKYLAKDGLGESSPRQGSRQGSRASTRRPSKSRSSCPNGNDHTSPNQENYPIEFSPPTEDAAQAIQVIQQDFHDNMDASEAEKKQVIRKYLMRWHPDKNPGKDKETATAVLQYIASSKVWFLESSRIPELAPLLL
eukprot:TRINITY_DN111429_c0_g1_i1.p1 TRINITY_DN111429_c0_g1~~TRINITY_DN111429_c0_g1_i1.p1  ORF type:complete len:319 (-),score=47.52 TRINITY_DN111429_c0_g1_i1:526-1482(-)